MDFSNYLLEQKPLLIELRDMLLKDYKYVSILANDCVGKTIVVSTNEVRVSDSSWQERGFVVRVYNGSNYFEYSFNEINKTNIQDIYNKIVNELAIEDSVNKTIYTEISKYDLIEEEEIKENFSKVESLEEHSVQSIIGKLRKLIDEQSEECEYLINMKTFLEYLLVSKLFISNKKDMQQVYLWADGAVEGVFNRDDVTKYNYGTTSACSIDEVLRNLAKITPGIILDGVELLSAVRPIPGEYEIISSQEITGLIAHEAFGHGVEMDMFSKNRALAAHYINKQIGSDIVNMHDGAIPYDDVSSYFFDDEGVLASDTLILKEGVLKTGICDTIAALKLKCKPTGNGKRESYKRKAYTRMTTTYFERGTSTFDEMVSSIKKGYYIDTISSGMEDPKNWGIQCCALIGKEIIDGKLTGKIVSPIIMSGYVPDLLTSISMTSRDFLTNGSGACGKGYKEWVKNACGGPCLKARVKIG